MKIRANKMLNKISQNLRCVKYYLLKSKKCCKMKLKKIRTTFQRIVKIKMNWLLIKCNILRATPQANLKSRLNVPSLKSIKRIRVCDTN